VGECNFYLGYEFVGERDDKKQTVLHIASYAGHYQLIDYFITSGRVGRFVVFVMTS
jgi:hypothetical protein